MHEIFMTFPGLEINFYTFCDIPWFSTTVGTLLHNGQGPDRYMHEKLRTITELTSCTVFILHSNVPCIR